MPRVPPVTIATLDDILPKARSIGGYAFIPPLS
jgi:hypothetical protein